MRSLRLAGRPVAPIDLLLARTAERIVRSDATIWVLPLEGTRDALRRGLAFAGIGASDDDLPVPRADLVPALGSDLSPATEPALDALTLSRLQLAWSTRRALGHPWLRAAWPAYRTRRRVACRALLRGSDEVVRWERRAWLAPGAIRLAAVRRSFRPIVFDRAALDALRPGGVLHADEGAITRWAFG
ncbi:MAG TPA: hypothetical protein VFW12_09770 [Candidatus Limnocylindria bacterium]|nr:hypothetical protein [Candidatus Limnocylindria bacterium]